MAKDQLPMMRYVRKNGRDQQEITIGPSAARMVVSLTIVCALVMLILKGAIDPASFAAAMKHLPGW